MARTLSTVDMDSHGNVFSNSFEILPGETEDLYNPQNLEELIFQIQQDPDFNVDVYMTCSIINTAADLDTVDIAEFEQWNTFSDVSGLITGLRFINNSTTETYNVVVRGRS